MIEDIFCKYVEKANKVMRKYNLDGYPDPYICQERDALGNKNCKECMVYRVLNYDEEALSLFK